MSAVGSSHPMVAARDRWLLPIIATMLGDDAAELLEREAVGSIWETVVERRLVAEGELVAQTARHFQLTIADVRRVSAQALELVPERWARQFGVLPLTIDNDTLVIATSNPCDVDCERALAFAAGRAVRFAVAPPNTIAARIDAVYGNAELDSVEQSQTVETNRHVDVEVLAGE